MPFRGTSSMTPNASYASTCKEMRQSLVLLFLLFFTSCWGATSKDQPSDQETIKHFKQHKELFDRIKDLALVTSEYKSDRMIQELLKEADCKSIAVYDGVVFITYFSGGTVLSSTDLEYVYMQPFQDVYGDTIPQSCTLREEYYKDRNSDAKMKSLGDGWYIRLLIE